MFNKSIFTTLVAFAFSFIILSLNASAQENHVSARIIIEEENIPTDKPFNIGVVLNIQPGWHIYAENPGNSGFKTEVKWSFDKKVKVSEKNTAPTPSRYETAGIVNYIYKNQTLYFNQAQYMDKEKDFSLFATAHVKYLVCKEVCIPEELVVERAFTLGPNKTASVDAKLFNIHSVRVAKINNAVKATTTLNNSTYTMTLKGLEKGAKFAHFMPSTEGFLDDASKQTWSESNNIYTLTFQKDIYNKSKFDNAQGILNLDDRQFIIIDSTISTIAEPTSTVNKNVIKAEKQNKTNQTTAADKENPESVTLQKDAAKQFTLEDIKTNRKLQMTLLFAFLGGLILNLMPCVLPVLSLKALSLIHHAKSKFSWWYGIVYTAGILCTFALLAFSIITLKDNGTDFGWGFQLQTPLFVASLSLLMLLVGLQLSSVFNFGASFGRLQNLVSGHGTIATFFSGMLMTVVATPCTAPFMATAIAFALAQPNDIIYATFGALGFGLAFPYLAITFSKRLLNLLPKPGAWEITFQHFLAFPMFATVLWLTWVYARQTSLNEVYFLFIALFVVSLTTWTFGRMNVLSSSRLKRWLGTLIFLCGIVYFFFTI
ncbi:MAG: DsbC/DsbD-like thiol-disulfide interchange protein/cytochrome c biogenesis protein CcdA, partial [bacterium]